MNYVDSTWICRLCLELAFLARKLGVKVVFIESCSGGLCSSWTTSIAGCSSWFEGGFVTYSNQMKQSVLGIDKKIIDKHGAVSRIVANKMVVSPSLKSFKGIVSTSVTGIAGPQGGSTLNGDALKAEAQAEMEKLEAEVSTAVPGGTGYGFTIG